ncbi:MAG TPA: hypothetical protein EYP62_08525 [Kiritimatiellae bacterium]|nr:hypothetical protein [Kiritimatiellia bacterium]
MAKRLFIDLEACERCTGCTVKCAAFYRVAEADNAVRGLREMASLVLFCRRCEEPACVAACGYEALERGRDGVLRRWNLRCVACKACSNACPFGTILPDVLTFYTVECDRCVHAGGEPVCVRECPEGAIQFREVSADEPGVHLIGDWLAVRSFKWEKEAV